MLSLYDSATGRVDRVTLARADVVRVACAGGLRSLVVGDLIRRIAGHHRLRTIGIWETVPGAADLNVRPAEFADGEADVHVGGTVGRCELASMEGLDPLAVRLALLSRHYREDVTLGREDLAAAQEDLVGWRRRVAEWAEAPGRPLSSTYVDEAVAALDADLATPAVFPLLARLAEDEAVSPGARFETVIKLDMILGLDLVGLVGRL